MADEIGKARNPVKKEGDIDGNAPSAAANRVVKKLEMDSDDDDEVPLAFSRAKLKTAAVSVSSSSVKVKKEEPTDRARVLKENSGKKIGENSNSKTSKVKKVEPEDIKKKSIVKITKSTKEEEKKTVKKGDIKGKENTKSSSLVVVTKKREKKSYTLPGQKHDPPEERDPLRIFYESLYNQLPGSEMASIWMMERGLLSESEARKVFEQKRQKGSQVASPYKPSPAKKPTPVNGSDKKPVSKTTTSSSAAKGKMVNSKDNKGKMPKKRKASSDEDSDDDFIASRKSNVSKKLKI